MKKGQLVEFLQWPYCGRIWTIESIHDNGTLQIRISAGQDWAWRMISAREEDIQSVEEETPSYEPENAPKIEYGYTKPTTLLEKTIRYVAIGAIAIVAIVIIWTASTKETETWLKKQTERLNQLNTEDVPDIEACKRTVRRKEEKEQILKDIKKYKESSQKDLLLKK